MFRKLNLGGIYEIPMERIDQSVREMDMEGNQIGDLIWGRNRSGSSQGWGRHVASRHKGSHAIKAISLELQHSDACKIHT